MEVVWGWGGMGLGRCDEEWESREGASGPIIPEPEPIISEPEPIVPEPENSTPEPGSITPEPVVGIPEPEPIIPVSRWNVVDSRLSSFVLIDSPAGAKALAACVAAGWRALDTPMKASHGTA